jgi:formylglycine-generating enzyme required for sulfatase activity
VAVVAFVLVVTVAAIFVLNKKENSPLEVRETVAVAEATPATPMPTPAPTLVPTPEPTPEPTPVDPLSLATKEVPFENTLGMKFVPVPGTEVLFCTTETRVMDYQVFCDATGRAWEKRTFPQTPDHPAVMVSWEDAKAFCEWLSKKEGRTYRLPTDAEWSWAVEIGNQEDPNATPDSKRGKIADVYPWDTQWPPPNDAGNYCGEECKTAAGLAELKAAGYDAGQWPVLAGFNDGKVLTAPVGSYEANGLGIYDLGGNVWEWCEDKYDTSGDYLVLRGGSWRDSYRDDLLSSYRDYYDPGRRLDSYGFRVVAVGSGR